MGWNISLVDNTVRFSKECAEELFAVGEEDEIWFGLEELKDQDGNYKLTFFEDHMEHMDYVYREDILSILKKYKVNGDITFTSNQGDNSGSSWGYRFKDGELTKLVGKIVFSEA